MGMLNQDQSRNKRASVLPHPEPNVLKATTSLTTVKSVSRKNVSATTVSEYPLMNASKKIYRLL
jgi:hypothetical protein